jgi:hypothetical protein
MARGKKINRIWQYAASMRPGDCFIYASIGSGKGNYTKTLGQCGDLDVLHFWYLWREGVVTHEADIEEYLAQPIEGLPGPEGEALTAHPVDIERELEMARNMFGKLRPDIKTRLRAVLYQPTEETWEDAKGIIIGADRFTTLWQAVIAVDPSFPRTGQVTDARGRVVERWKKIPSQETLIKALRYATH